MGWSGFLLGLSSGLHFCNSSQHLPRTLSSSLLQLLSNFALDLPILLEESSCSASLLTLTSFAFPLLSDCRVPHFLRRDWCSYHLHVNYKCLPRDISIQGTPSAPDWDQRSKGYTILREFLYFLLIIKNFKGL